MVLRQARCHVQLSSAPGMNSRSEVSVSSCMALRLAPTLGSPSSIRSAKEEARPLNKWTSIQRHQQEGSTSLCAQP